MADKAATPDEFIAARKSEHPRQLIELETAQHALADEDLSKVDLRALVEEMNNTDYAQRLLTSIRPRLPDNVSALLENGTIAVGEIDEPTFDAYAVPVGQGHAIIIHRGTHQFIY